MTLTWKFFLGTASVVVAVLGGALYATNRKAEDAAATAVDQGLAKTRDQVTAFLRSREQQLTSGAKVFVQPAPFRSLLETRQTANMLEQSEDAATQIGADWVQITDEAGVRLAKSDAPSAPPDTLAGSALIGGALEAESRAGFGTSGDTLLFQAVAVPIMGTGEGTVVGALMAAKYVDSAGVEAMKEAAGGGTELVFFALDTLGKPHIVASTLGRGKELSDVVVARVPAMMPAWKPGTEMTPADSLKADSLARRGQPRSEAEIGGVHYVGQGDLVRSASNNALGGFIALQSRDAALGPFRDLQRTILVAAGVGLLLAFLFSWIIAHQIARPIGALVSATKKVADGDYAADIPINSRDEIGTLASAFRAMLADLRDKEALVAVLSAKGPEGDGRTIQIRHVTPTMQLAAGMETPVEPGQTFANRYAIEDVLGVGGMGMVYKAVDRELGETVAIKTLKADMMRNDPTALERFKSEIRLARKISHRNVVRTHDLGENSGVYFITMEYVEGTSLKDLIRTRGRLPVPATLTVGKQLCRALEVAHEQGVIHRDIKPQNMVLEPGGVLKVMDFGIARLAQRGANDGHTQAGMVVGTPEYMAPEQLLGDDVDARVDIWAAGVVLYECLTGRLPFVADTPIALISRLLETTPTPPRGVIPDIPQAMSDLVMRTLSRDRDQRPRSAAELHDLLAQLD